MKRDARLRQILVRALIVEPDRKAAGEILDEWDKLKKMEASALGAPKPSDSESTRKERS